jgi:formylglycine-generating enzyme required for sulfatase activity
MGDTTQVGSYESGKSLYNAYDMAGNVEEWVNDYYQSDYYAVFGDITSNPVGPESGESRVLRGGSWGSGDYVARSANRNWVGPTYTIDDIGFRCARSLP